MHKAIAFGVAVSLALGGHASARAKFTAYEGKDAIVDGRGGTKVTKDGIDFWTTGEPPRRFQVLGVLTDKRGTGLFAGDAVGAPSVVKRIQELGGSAAIVLNQKSQQAGTWYSGSASAYGNSAYGSGFAVPVMKATTQLLVVKYLDDDKSEAPPQQAPAPEATPPQ